MSSLDFRLRAHLKVWSENSSGSRSVNIDFLWHFGIENTGIGDDLILPSCPPSFLHILYVSVDRDRLSHSLRFQTRVLSEVFKNAIPVQRTAHLNYTPTGTFEKE